MNYIEQLMKDNNIEVNEEFYIMEPCDNCGGYERLSCKFHFDEDKELSTEEGYKYSRRLCMLLSGKCYIEKIPHKPKKAWDLKKGDEYYIIYADGIVNNRHFEYSADIDIVESGNAFLTREEAEFESERRKCEAGLLNYGTRDMMSIGDEGTKKYHIYYSHADNSLDIDIRFYTQFQGTIYFKSKELAQKAIDEVGEERLKKYIFNVKE